MCQHVKEMN